jgi:hypothetical protein
VHAPDRRNFMIPGSTYQLLLLAPFIPFRNRPHAMHRDKQAVSLRFDQNWFLGLDAL